MMNFCEVHNTAKDRWLEPTTAVLRHFVTEAEFLLQ